MGLTDQTALHVADEVACTVHPAVLFSIVDHFSRREEDQQRVIGTLLGTVDEGSNVTGIQDLHPRKSNPELAATDGSRQK